MIVVDTNVIAYFWLQGEMTSQAEAVLQKDPEWAAPVLWRSEFQNILAGYLRRGAIDLMTAAAIAEKGARQMSTRQYAVGSFEILKLVSESRCSAYDCEFVALAQELEVPLVTADKLIISAFPDTAISLSRFAA